ncbi:MAG: flagellar hook-length control protein FliK [Treponema sp.]|nr:flagellar hook-length control protein FliK [Treponema sp.]
MITISAYTEPQLLYAVSEQLQPYEPEDTGEHGEFAEILAGMLRKADAQETAGNEGADAPPVDLSGAENSADVPAAEKNLFFTHEDSLISVKNAVEKIITETEIPQTELSQEELFKTDLSEAELLAGGLSANELPADMLADEHQDIALSAEYLLSRSIDTAASDINTNIDDAGIDIPPELFQTGIAAHDIKPDSNSSPVKTETDNPLIAPNAAAELAAAENAAAVNVEPAAETKNKKESVSNVNEKIETLPGENTRGDEIAGLRKEPGNDGRGRYDDSRSRSRRDKVTFDVRDLRTGTDANAPNNIQASVTGAEKTRVQGSNEITLELRLPGSQNSAGQSVQQAQTSWEARSGSALENMLARELHNFNGDIVRHASMALRNGGEGTIKLALKPESLGNVKIQLEMTENKITGIIVVESEEALNAFRKELASLEQAFRESGYESADLNLSLTADGKSTQERQQEADAFTPRNVASRYDESFELDSLPLADVFYGRGTGAINMLA